MQKGLSSIKAAELLKEHGENMLSAEKHRGAAALFASQFKDLLTLILLCSTVISFLLGEYIDAVTIMTIVFINAILGFAQEYRTERTLEKLRAIAAPKAMVYRDGEKTEIPASLLVPGDVVMLSAGCKVPADGKVISATELFANESLLTGESAAVQKLVHSDDDDSIRRDCVYMGTSITGGHGEFSVTSTGMSTQMGKIAGLLKESKPESTPLQKRLSVLSKYIAVGCIIICFIVTLTGILRGEPVFDMFLIGLSLSVAAIPEGLTAVITISLGLAVSRMLKKNALIRRLHSVETLGCADVICSDKTGTLTENKMTVTEVFIPEGKSFSEKELFKNANLSQKLLLAALLCNNAEQNEHGEISGEPTEAALLEMVLKNFGGTAKSASKFRRIAEIPFDSTRKLMSVAVKNSKGEGFVFVKGAPDVLLPLCGSYYENNEHRSLSPTVLNRCKEQLLQMATGALRVLALGYKEYSGGKITENGFTLLGFCGMLDPPRKGAAESVLKCRSAGIRTVMITGDHPETALAIAKKLHIAKSSSDVKIGAQLDSLSGSEFINICEHTNVFARVTPAHKLKIVRALKKSGHIVAMTGDGVNDAPAVKEADIGVSMGKNGTDVTREAGGIVLLDDDFSTLVSAVEEGRIIYQNIRKFIRYLLSCNIGEVVTMFFGMLMGMPVVLLPIQILMVNLVTDGIPAIALSFDPPQDDVMAQLPRSRNDSVFSGGLALTIILRGVLLGLSVLAAFTCVLNITESIEHARTAAFVTLVFTQLVHVFECKSETRSLFTINIFNNIKLIFAVISSAVIVLSTVYLPGFQPVFKTVTLGTNEMLTILAATLSVPLISSVIMLIRHGK